VQWIYCCFTVIYRRRFQINTCRFTLWKCNLLSFCISIRWDIHLQYKKWSLMAFLVRILLCWQKSREMTTGPNFLATTRGAQRGAGTHESRPWVSRYTKWASWDWSHHGRLTDFLRHIDGIHRQRIPISAGRPTPCCICHWERTAWSNRGWRLTNISLTRGGSCSTQCRTGERRQPFHSTPHSTLLIIPHTRAS